jgi:hypothetical protein
MHRAARYGKGRRIRAVLRPGAAAQELVEELASHLEMETQQNLDDVGGSAAAGAPGVRRVFLVVGTVPVAGVVACLVPALRAVGVEPAEALRMG